MKFVRSAEREAFREAERKERVELVTLRKKFLGRAFADLHRSELRGRRKH